MKKLFLTIVILFIIFWLIPTSFAYAPAYFNPFDEVLILLTVLFFLFIYNIIWFAIISLINKLFWFINTNLFLVLLKDFTKIFISWIVFIVLWVYLPKLYEHSNLYYSFGGGIGISIIIIVLFILTFSLPLYKIHNNWRKIIIESIWKKDNLLLLNFKIYACIFIVLISILVFNWVWIFLAIFWSRL